MDASRPDKVAKYRQQVQSHSSKPSSTWLRRPSTWRNWRRTRIADRPLKPPPRENGPQFNRTFIELLQPSELRPA